MTLEEEHKARLREQLGVLRRLQHEDETTEARYGLSCDPAIKIRIQDRQKNISQIEAQLGITQPTSASTSPCQFASEVTRTRSHIHDRQRDIEQQLRLLSIHRRTLGYLNEQAKAYGGLNLAPPVTRHGIDDAKAGIAKAKQALVKLGASFNDLPSDE